MNRYRREARTILAMLSAEVAERRFARGLTLRQLAEILSLSPATLSRIERGKESTATAAAICAQWLQEVHPEGPVGR